MDEAKKQTQNESLLKQQQASAIRFTLLSASLFTLPLGNQLTNFVLLALLLFSPFVYRKDDWKQVYSHPMTWAPALFFAFHVISLLWSSDTSNGLVQLETKMGLLLVPLFMRAGSLRLTDQQLNGLMRAFVYGALVALFYALAYAVFRAEHWTAEMDEVISPSSYFFYERLADPLMHPGYFSLHVGAALLIVIGSQAFSTNWWRASLILMLLIGLWLLQGRMQILALLMIGGGVLFGRALLQARWRKFLAIALGALLLLAILVPKRYFGRFVQLPKWEYNISGGPEDFNSATYRLAEWSSAWVAIQRAPILGSGIGDNRKALFKVYEERQFFQGLKMNFNAHNQFLETSLVLGLLGLLALLFWMGTYLKEAIQQRSLLLLTLWSFGVLSLLTESMLERAWGVLFFALFWPLVWRTGNSRHLPQ